MFEITWKSRTTWIGVIAVLTAIAGYLSGDVGVAGAIAGVLAGLATITGRAAIPVAKAAAPLLIIALLAGCGTTGAQGQDTSQGTVDMKANGGLFYAYKEKGAGSKRTTTGPVLDKKGNPVLSADGLPMFTTIVEEGASGPLVLNYGTISADIDQAPQGSQAGSGTQAKTDTATPTTSTTATIPATTGP